MVSPDLYRQAFRDMGFGTQKWGVDPNLGATGKWGADPFAAPLSKWGVDPMAISMAPSLTGMSTLGLFGGGPPPATAAPSGYAPSAPSYSAPSYTPTSYAPSSYVPSAPASYAGTSNATPAVGSGGWGNVTRWSPEVKAAIDRVEAQTGVRVPENVVYAVMELESGGEHVGYNSAGYGGLMQVGPGSNVSDWDTDYAASPEGNIYYGVQELANWYGVTGDWNTAPLAYFSGYNYDNPNVSDGHYTVAQYDQHIQNNLQQLGGIESPNAAGAYGAPGLSALGPGTASNPRRSGVVITYSDGDRGGTGAVPGYTMTAPSAPPAGQPGGWISSITNGQQYPLSQEYGLTDWAMGAGADMYGYTTEYNEYGEYMGHPGLDISMEIGTPLYAPVTGVVVQAGGVEWEADERYGATPGTGGLRIQLPNGDIVVMGHMQQIDVQVGDTVTAGQAVGSSGTANGGHLHLEYRMYTPGKTGSGYTLVDPRTVPLSSTVAKPATQTTGISGLFGGGTPAVPQNRVTISRTGVPTSNVNADQYRYSGAGSSSLFGGQASNSQKATQQQQLQIQRTTANRLFAPTSTPVNRPVVAAPSGYIPGSTYVPPAPPRPMSNPAPASNSVRNSLRGLFGGS